MSEVVKFYASFESHKSCSTVDRENKDESTDEGRGVRVKSERWGKVRRMQARRERNERFRVAGVKTASRSSAILAKFYDVCSRDVQSLGEECKFPPLLYGAGRRRYEPHGSTDKQGRRELRWRWGRTVGWLPEELARIWKFWDTARVPQVHNNLIFSTAVSSFKHTVKCLEKCIIIDTIAYNYSKDSARFSRNKIKFQSNLLRPEICCIVFIIFF